MPQEAPNKQAEIEHTLDDYERELLQAIEEGQLAPAPGPIPDKALLEEAARKTLAKSERRTIRVTKMDLQALKHCAAREGVPYHTLISSVLHKYITGQLVPSRHLVPSTIPWGCTPSRAVTHMLNFFTSSYLAVA
jgi:predicted DNA binding CopG/RHH family protein